MQVRITKCSQPGSWWEKHLGRIVTVLWTDSHGHWTRDTNTEPEGYPFLQWIAIEDCDRLAGSASIPE